MPPGLTVSCRESSDQPLDSTVRDPFSMSGSRASYEALATPAYTLLACSTVVLNQLNGADPELHDSNRGDCQVLWLSQLGGRVRIDMIVKRGFPAP
jgi:hypothetical protein